MYLGYMGKQNRMRISNILNKFLIHNLELVTPPRISHNYVCTGKPCICAFATFSTHALREWAWPRAQIKMTIFTRFAHSCTMHIVALQQGWRKHFVSQCGAAVCVRVWGHAPPRKFCNLQPLRLLLVDSQYYDVQLKS